MTLKHQFIQSVLVLLQALVLLGGLAGCAVTTSPPPDLTPVTVQLSWTHSAQFAGFYAADQNGYYAANGVAATFIQGGPQVDPLAVVQAGEAQFGTAGADILIAARARNQPVRAIAVIYRRSPVVFVAKASSGIARPEDFAGQKIRVTSSLVPSLHAMTAQVGVTPNQYTEVVLPSDPDLFVSNQVPIWGGYLDGFVLTLQQLGHDLNIIYPDDYGVHFYADTIFTTDNLITTQPDLVRRFLQAPL